MQCEILNGDLGNIWIEFLVKCTVPILISGSDNYTVVE